jgi:hypothetical protein
MDEPQQVPEPHDPDGEGGAPDYARPEARSRRPWAIAAVVGAIVVVVGGFFGVKAIAGGGSSSASTASQAPNGGSGGGGRRGTVGTLQSIDGSTLTVATFNRGGNEPHRGAAGGTATVITNGSTKFYKTVSGSPSDIKVGDRVTAMGTPDGTNAVTAQRVTDVGAVMDAGFGGPGGGGARRFGNGGNGNGAPPSNPNVTRPDPNSFASGTVKSISGSSLTVTQQDGTTKTVTTNASTAVSVLKTVSINDLATGQPIVVRGTTNSDGTVKATNVVQGVGGFGGGGFRGRLGGGGGGGGQPPETGSTTQ